jgi:hypothetical protein
VLRTGGKYQQGEGGNSLDAPSQKLQLLLKVFEMFISNEPWLVRHNELLRHFVLVGQAQYHPTRDCTVVGAKRAQLVNQFIPTLNLVLPLQNAVTPSNR